MARLLKFLIGWGVWLFLFFPFSLPFTTCMIPSTHEVPPFPPLLSSLFGRVFLFGLGSITTGVSSFFFSLFYLIKLVQGIFEVGCGRKGLACFVYAGLQGGGGWFGLVYTWSTAAHVFLILSLFSSLDCGGHLYLLNGSGGEDASGGRGKWRCRRG